MDNKGGRFRKKIKFTQMSNNVIRDKKLSFKAKGLYSLIQSYITLEDFEIYKGFLLKQCVEGQKAFDSAWKELKDHGYLKQYRIPTGSKGTFAYEYDLLDEADVETPGLINCDKNGNPINKNKGDHIPQNGGSGENSDHTPLLVPNGQCTPCSTYSVDKGGYISNTDSNNTDSNNTNKTDVMSDKIHKTLTKENIAITKEKIQEIINHIRNTQDLTAVKNLPAYLTTCIRNYISENQIKQQPTQSFAGSLNIEELDRLITYGNM